MAAREELEDLSRRFLNGDPTSIFPFQSATSPLLLRIARKHAPDLAPDLLEDVVQETMLLLLQARGVGYDPARGNALTFIRLIARRAARDVSAQYAPAGRRTRPPLKAREKALDQFRRGSSVDSLDELLERDTPSSKDSIETADARLDVAFVLHRAPDAVKHGLQRIYLDDVSVVQAAGEVQLSRFALSRLIVNFCASVAA